MLNDTDEIKYPDRVVRLFVFDRNIEREHLLAEQDSKRVYVYYKHMLLMTARRSTLPDVRVMIYHDYILEVEF